MAIDDRKFTEEKVFKNNNIDFILLHNNVVSVPYLFCYTGLIFCFGNVFKQMSSYLSLDFKTLFKLYKS